MATLPIQQIKLRGTWALAAAAGVVPVTHKQRHGRQRLKLGADTLTVSVERDQLLNDGDALVTETGTHYLVRTVQERVLLVSCADTTVTARLAWHLGARGVPLEIQAGGVIIPDSPANRRLVAGLGAEGEPVKRVFTPELSELIRPPRRRG
jgi:urease accessory protein